MATTPSPLPIPAPTPATNPLALSLQAVAAGVPQIDPEVAAGIAQASPSPDAALQTAQATQGYVNAVNLKNYLEGQPSVNQAQGWAQQSATMQAMLRGAGYKPPAPHRSLWGAVTQDVGGAFHDTLNALGAPYRAETHIERTLFAVANQTAGSGDTGSWTDLFHALHTPGDWANAWNETANGTQYILPQVQAQVRKQYGDQTFAAALALAKGKTVTELVGAAPAAQQQQLATTLQSPTVQAAANTLLAGHVSVGRMLARSVGLNPGPGQSLDSPGAVVSGLTDAFTMWRGDPVNIGLKGIEAANAAKYLVQTGADVDHLYKTQPAVQRAFSDIAEHLNSPSPDAIPNLVDRYPTLEPALDTMKSANLHTADDVADWMGQTANLKQIISGAPGRLPGGIEGGVLPHLSTAGQARLAAKGFLQNKIDFLADHPATIAGLEPGDAINSPLNPSGAIERLQTGGGLFMRHLLTLTPASDTFNPYDTNWFSKLRNVALMSLPRPRVNQLLTDYANAATIGQRRLVYQGLLKEVMAAAGVDHLPSVSQWMDEATNPDNAESILSHQSYSALGKDLTPDESGINRPAAISRGQTSDEWAMPTYRDLYAQTKKLGIIQAANGALNNRMIDTFMNTMWKPMSLARFGFSLRVAGEEAFGLLLRNGPTAALRARAAASAVARGSADGSEDSTLGRVWDSLTAHLPQSVRDRIVTPVDLAAEYLSDAASRALGAVEGFVGGPRLTDYIKTGMRHGVGSPDGAFGRYVSSGEGHSGNFYDTLMSSGQPRIKVWDQGRMVSARLNPTGAYVGYKPTAQVYTQHWYKRLREIATDPWLRPALVNRDLPLNERISAVADKLTSDRKWADNWRSFSMRDGRTAAGGASTDELARDHAAVIVDHVDYHLTDPNGNPIEGLAQHLVDHRRPPTTAALDEIPEETRPPAVSGPESVPVLQGGSGAWSRGVNAMFSVIGKQIDWISRTPMFWDNFARSMDAFKQSGHLATWQSMMSPENAEEAWVKAATDRALSLTIPYIHHPELRSQMSIITRNVAPFWFAQEQFYKRWARTMSFAPSAFRRAQLINQGVYHSGFTHTDPVSGQQYFVYPGAGVVQDVLSRTLSAFGYNSWLPIEANLRGQVKMASPGLERLGLPNLGPAAVIPLHFLSGLFPELKGPVGSVEGGQTAGASYTQSLVPSTVQRIWTDFTATPGNSPQYASAMMQAIQYLEATGHGIGTVATRNLGSTARIGAPSLHGAQYKPGDYVTDQANHTWVMEPDGQWRENSPAAETAYMERVKNWTRIFLVTRTIFGFNVPASPENLFDPNHVNEDFQTLLKTLPYNEAVAAFMTLHPDATAYTVFQSKDMAGAPLPATASALAFMDANAAFFKAHPLAGAMFIPAQDSSGKYDKAAYLKQMSDQLRTRRTPAQFWQEIAYTQAANVYFAGENHKNAMLNNNFAARNAVDQAWTAQSQAFQKANPLFAQQLADSGGAYNRAAIEQDLQGALNDPRLPETPQTEDLRTLFNGYLNYQAMTAPYSQPGGNSMSGAQRYRMEVDFAAQAEAFVAAHPDAQNLFDRLIRPGLSSVLTTQATAPV